jgi:hypothetical protein
VLLQLSESLSKALMQQLQLAGPMQKSPRLLPAPTLLQGILTCMLPPCPACCGSAAVLMAALLALQRLTATVPPRVTSCMSASCT